MVTQEVHPHKITDDRALTALLKGWKAGTPPSGESNLIPFCLWSNQLDSISIEIESSGEVRAQLSGLYYYGARYYAP